jgi:hypothetical protein
MRRARALCLLLALACTRPPVPGRDAAPRRSVPADAGASASPVEPPDEPEPADEDGPRRPTERVKLKLTVTPAAAGVVMWGRRKLADLAPGQMTVEIERPKESGPLDVVIKATGFLPHHVRLFTDREDRLSVHLVRPDESRALLGYHH